MRLPIASLRFSGKRDGVAFAGCHPTAYPAPERRRRSVAMSGHGRLTPPQQRLRAPAGGAFFQEGIDALAGVFIQDRKSVV